MTRALLLPLAAIVALGTGLGMIGVAATLTVDPFVVPTAGPTATSADESPISPTADPLRVDVLLHLPAGPASVRAARHTLAPGSTLASEMSVGPRVLVVEAGVLTVLADGAAWVGDGLDAAQVETMLAQGDRLVVRPGAFHVVRNDSLEPAMVLIIAINPALAP